MNAELLALVQALDAVKESPPTRPEEGLRLKEIYESRLGDVLERHPGLFRETLHTLVERQRRLWLAAETKTSTLPPKA